MGSSGVVLCVVCNATDMLGDTADLMMEEETKRVVRSEKDKR